MRPKMLAKMQTWPDVACDAANHIYRWSQVREGGNSREESKSQPAESPLASSGIVCWPPSYPVNM